MSEREQRAPLRTKLAGFNILGIPFDGSVLVFNEITNNFEYQLKGTGAGLNSINGDTDQAQIISGGAAIDISNPVAGETSIKVSNGGIEELQLANEAVTQDKIKDGAVTVDKIPNLSLTSIKLQDNSVINSKINLDAVTEDKILDSAVAEEKLANSAVTNIKLAVNAVTRDKILNGEIITDKIANVSVNSSKIENLAVIDSKIANKTITFGKIADGNIVNINLGVKAVTKDKMGSQSEVANQVLVTDGSGGYDFSSVANLVGITEINGDTTQEQTLTGGAGIQIINDGIGDHEFNIPTNSIITDMIKPDAITAPKIANNSIGNNNLQDNAVSSTKIQTNAITQSKMASGSVATSSLVSSAVTTPKINGQAVTTSKIEDSAITEEKIDAGAVTSAKLAVNSVTNTRINNSAVTEPKIISNAISESKIQDGAVVKAKMGSQSALAGEILIADGNGGYDFTPISNFIGITSINGDTTQEQILTASDSIKITNPTAGETIIGVLESGIDTLELADDAVTIDKMGSGAEVAGAVLVTDGTGGYVYQEKSIGILLSTPDEDINADTVFSWNAGAGGGSTDLTERQTLLPIAISLEKVVMRIGNNTRSTDTEFTVTRNGATTPLTVTVLPSENNKNIEFPFTQIFLEQEEIGFIVNVGSGGGAIRLSSFSGETVQKEI